MPDLISQSIWLPALALIASAGIAATAAAGAALSLVTREGFKPAQGVLSRLANRQADSAAVVMTALRHAGLLARLGFVAVGMALLTQHGFGFAASFALCLLGIALISLVAKALALPHPQATLVLFSPLTQVFAATITPVTRALTGIGHRLAISPDEARHADNQQIALRNDIAGAIAMGHSGGAVEKEHRDRLLGALDLADRAVDEIMRHRRQIEMINADDPPGKIVTQVLASPHSRLPVFRDEEENILGVIHTKDLVREVDRLVRSEDGSAVEGLQALDILKVAMKPYFIPDTTSLDEQMREFLKRRTHFALVVDEYGALQGLITLEDILEEIVGDITDEFDVVSRSSLLKRTESGDFIVDGAMTIRDLNRAMDWHLPDDEANTIAGLVIHEAQMIPVERQVFLFHGFRFEISQRRENRITQLKLRPVQTI